MKFVLYLASLLPAWCLYGQICWPNVAKFTALEYQLSQPLIRPAPHASACYPPSDPISANCSDAITHRGDEAWIADRSGAYQNVNFETCTRSDGTIEGCYLNTTLGFPCQQGSVPPIGVDARSVEDVQAAVRFAGHNNLRLIVKNTGHDYLGRSAGRGGFMLWTHHLKNITSNPSFVPDGGSPSATFNAITLGAGVQWHEAYDAAQEVGRFLVGGLSGGGTVGAAGGWVMGGGHSAFASRHGLGVDNVIQFTVVTANGDHITANAYQNADLFWALRGGGGGSWGVVTSVTYKTHETFPMVMVRLASNFTSNKIAKSVLEEYIKLLPDLANKGWGGYSALSNETFQALYVAPNISIADANATLSPFSDYIRNATGTEAMTMAPYESFYSWYKELFGSNANAAGGSQVGHNVELGSRFISKDMAEFNPERVVDVMLAINGGVAINFVAGGVASQVSPDSTGLNPAWRKAVAHVYFAESWNDGASGAVVQAARQRVRKGLKILNGLSTDFGTYLNEASLYEEDFKETFFGAHYNRLKDIKRKYDPEGLFVVASGVGSDDWDGSLECRL
ncbi:hypothetical protein BDQ17DRAFT_1503458 [Cyathus striatus]|nr:hypothetical protein BDQ17DRAFT_1503458 [Cyathus striatus]